MRTIEKVVVLAMTMSLAFVLSACGSSASSSAASSGASSSASASSAAASSTSASATSASSGSTATDRYTNEYFGIAFMLPSGWSFMDTSNLKEINSHAAVSAGSAVGMVASSADGQTNVIVAIEEANSTNSGQTAETHLDAQVKQTTESASSGNFSYTSETSTITFEGAETKLPAAMTKLSVNGSTICICQIVMEKNGDFLDIVIQGTSEEAVTEALKGFHLILS